MRLYRIRCMSHQGRSTFSLVNPHGQIFGPPGQEFSHDARTYRGGSYNYHEAVARTAYRFPVYPFIGNDHFGGRVVLRPATTTFNGQG